MVEPWSPWATLPVQVLHITRPACPVCFISAGVPLEFLILDLTPSGHVDSSGCHTIGVELASRLRKKGIQVVLAGPNSKVLRNLERAGVLDEVGRDWVFSNVADA